jgi:hypothetical protein
MTDRWTTVSLLEPAKRLRRMVNGPLSCGGLTWDGEGVGDQHRKDCCNPVLVNRRWGGQRLWEPLMPTFGRRIDGPAGRRHTQREEVVLAGSALTLGASRTVVVTDVSPAGAKLLGRKLPAAGTDVLLSVGSVELFGEIAWLGRDECGISFDTPLDTEVADHLKREGRWAKVMGIAAAN